MVNELVKSNGQNDGFAVASYVISQVGPLAQMAEMYSRGGLVPVALIGKPDAIFTILTAGVELGIGPATALRTIHVIEGRACLSAGIMVGLAMQAGVVFEYQQQDATACRIKWTRGSSSGVVVFTIENAATAGLADKPNWKKYPAAMLTARCQSMAARQSAPDRLAGLYAPEELDAPVRVAQSGDVEMVEVLPPLPQMTVEPAKATKAQTQRIAITARELGITTEETYPGDGKPHTAFKTDSGANDAAGVPDSDVLFILDLTKVQASRLIDWMEERKAMKMESAQQDDAAEALGGTNG